MTDNTVIDKFREAYSDGIRWKRQEGIGGEGRFSACWKFQYRPRATIYFRDEEQGNIARIAGKATFFPKPLKNYLAGKQVPRRQENGYWDWLIGPEHVDLVLDILLHPDESIEVGDK